MAISALFVRINVCQNGGFVPKECEVAEPKHSVFWAAVEAWDVDDVITCAGHSGHHIFESIFPALPENKRFKDKNIDSAEEFGSPFNHPHCGNTSGAKQESR